MREGERGRHNKKEEETITSYQEIILSESHVDDIVIGGSLLPCIFVTMNPYPYTWRQKTKLYVNGK
jgi:hypothetical protein